MENTDVQLETLEKLTSDIEFALVERQIIDGLKVGNEALKKIHEVLSIDEVEQILDETRESVEKQNVIIKYYIFYDYHTTDLSSCTGN